MSMRGSYGSARVGVSPTVEVGSLRTRNISAYAVYSEESIDYFEIQDSAYNSSKFLIFIEIFLGC